MKNKMGPYISVIVPLFNNEDIIAQNLEAIKNQKDISNENYEIIVVDDCSTDDSANIAIPLCDKLVKLDENQGAAAARNAGAKEASGELLVFVDSDVFLESSSLSLLKGLFEKDKDLCAAVGRYTEQPFHNNTINVYHNLFTRYHHDLSPSDIDWFWGAIGAVRKKEFNSVGGFDERYKGASAEDMELGLALSKTGHKIRYFPKAMGTHAHYFTLKSMLVNDYKKAVLGAKLRFAGDLPQKAPEFGSVGNILTVPFLSVPFLMIFSSFYLGSVYPFLFACIFTVFLLDSINRKFYRYLAKHAGFNVLKMILLHCIQMGVVVFGAVIGMAGYLLGKSRYGRPGLI
jgi:glycosyltransferase involved in cell wall biosynthesis